MGLTNEDREALAADVWLLRKGWAQSHLNVTVEQIIARHATEARAAALNEAAEAIENKIPDVRKHRLLETTVRDETFRDAGALVRNLANSPPP